jgi:hypothetical protein
MTNLEPFNPKKHKPIQTVGSNYATEYIASEISPEGTAWNIPLIWFNTETGSPTFLPLGKAWETAYEYENETGKKFPRFNKFKNIDKNLDEATKSAEKRSKKGGASKGKLAKKGR